MNVLLYSRQKVKMKLAFWTKRCLALELKKSTSACKGRGSRCASSVALNLDDQKTADSEAKKSERSGQSSAVPLECRFVYPEFLPDPKVEWRNPLRERLERIDMLSRRVNIDIPEFYVGTIMAVTVSNPHAPEKTSRFVGICIERTGCGLRATFTLRNVIDHQGVEMFYEMYNPTIQKIEVLRLEKRPDDDLLYLRDALPEYSTFPLDMEPEILPEGAPVPVNETKVKLKPRPWLQRYERMNYKGIDDLGLPQKFYDRAGQLATPWEKYDLMKEYRKSIPEEDQKEIYAEVYSELQQLEIARKKMKRKRGFVKPKKAG